MASVSIALAAGCGRTAAPANEAKSAEKSGKITNIYLAGPFFNDEEIRNVETAEKVLAERGFSYFSPMRHTVDAEKGTSEWARKIFEMDKTEIDKADAVVALYYSSNGDTGTAWECGYAAAKGIPIILVHTKKDADSNLMMHCGCTTNISLDELRDYDFDTMPVYEYKGKMF